MDDKLKAEVEELIIKWVNFATRQMVDCGQIPTVTVGHYDRVLERRWAFVPGPSDDDSGVPTIKPLGYDKATEACMRAVAAKLCPQAGECKDPKCPCPAYAARLHDALEAGQAANDAARQAATFSEPIQKLIVREEKP